MEIDPVNSNSDRFPLHSSIQFFDQAAQQQFAAIVENMAEAFFALNLTGYCTYLNQKAEQLLGADRTTLIGKAIWHLFGVDAGTQLDQQCHRAVIEQQLVEFEAFYPLCDRWFAVRLLPTPSGISAYFQDISERKQTEAALRQEQEFLSVLLDNVQAGIVACDADGRLKLFNQTARSFHGISEQPLPPEQWAEHYDLYLPDGKTPMNTEDIPLYRALQGLPVQDVEMTIVPRQGTTRLLLAKGQAIYNRDGEKQGAVVVMHDITDRKQAEVALRKTEQRYRSVVDNVKEVIFQTDTNGNWTFLNPAWTEITGFSIEESLGTCFLDYVHPDDRQRNLELFQPLIQRDKAYCRHEIRYLTKSGGFRWIEVFARLTLEDDGTMLGTSGTLNDITERKQAEEERVRLIQEQTARTLAEKAQRQSAFLAEVSEVLASSLEYEQTLQSVAHLAVPDFADWCSVDLLNDDGTISRVAVAHSDPEKVQLGWELARRFPRHLEDGYGISEVMKTGKSEMAIAITDEQLVATVKETEYLEILLGIGLRSCIIAPLPARGRVLGGVSFIFAESNRQYSTDDLRLAEDLARRAAIAIDNARLYRAAQQAKQAAERAADRTARLQMVTAALSESLTPPQVAEVIVEQSRAALEADTALMALLTQDGTTLEIVRTIGYESNLDETYQQFSLNASFPLAEAVRTGQPIWSEPLENRLARYPHLAEIYKRLPFQAWISLPLMVEGKAVGGLSLSFKQFKQLDRSDREFMLALSRQCAQAISRTQLYEAERQARAEAEQANRVKDEFLAVLSHELRTPLNPILGWSKLLQNQQHDPAMLARGLQTIERNAKLQTQLIEDLLDVSRILRGKLSLEASPIDLQFPLEAAMETVRLAAEAKSIQMQAQFNSDVGLVSGDAGRLQQVFWNLLSNAVKFTPQGGQVQIRLAQVDTQAQIQISDTGKGITPEFLPYIFERFRQADSKTTRQFGGLGLGLAIVRQLVELHGGTVQVDSLGEGQGTTFTVRLPLIGGIVTCEEEELESFTALATSKLCLQGVRVLVVDDEPDARDLLAFILEDSGAIVTAANSGAEALQALRELEFDVLISDIGMPEMDGYMLMQQVQSQARQISTKAIALTAYAGEMNQQKALEAGFHYHLSKPVEALELIRAIASLVNLV